MNSSFGDTLISWYSWTRKWVLECYGNLSWEISGLKSSFKTFHKMRVSSVRKPKIKLRKICISQCACCALATAKRVLRRYVFRIVRISFVCISFVILWHLTWNVKQKFEIFSNRNSDTDKLSIERLKFLLVFGGRTNRIAWNRNDNGQNERVLNLMRINHRVVWPQRANWNESWRPIASTGNKSSVNSPRAVWKWLHIAQSPPSVVCVCVCA